jgi:hypothetical protein
MLLTQILATSPSNGSAVLCASAQKVPVNAEVQSQHQAAQKKLDVSGEGRGVQHRQDIVLDEVTLVRRASSGGSEAFLQRREGTDPPSELDQCAPQRGGHMQVSHPSPSQHEQSTEDHEEHEREVEGDDEVGKDSREAGKRGSGGVHQSTFSVAAM